MTDMESQQILKKLDRVDKNVNDLSVSVGSLKMSWFGDEASHTPSRLDDFDSMRSEYINDKNTNFRQRTNETNEFVATLRGSYKVFLVIWGVVQSIITVFGPIVSSYVMGVVKAGN